MPSPISISSDTEYQTKLSQYAKLLEDQNNDRLDTSCIVLLQMLERAIDNYEREMYQLGVNNK